jgi:hypothetical protein
LQLDRHVYLEHATAGVKTTPSDFANKPEKLPAGHIWAALIVKSPTAGYSIFREKIVFGCEKLSQDRYYSC